MSPQEELSEALIALNELKEKEIIQDYAIGGGHAIIHHKVHYSSYDLDIFAIIASEDSLRILQPVYKYFREGGNEIKGEHIIIGDMPIQILPNISPLHNNAVEEADKVEIGGIPTKVIGVEYLIALALVAFRKSDKERIVELLKKADKGLLNRILDRFDNDENQLRKRYQKVLAIS
ncbi:nucleotidyltransferase [Chloroflexota bacterium]